MAIAAPETWVELLRETLARYDEELLRGVAGRLVRPRGHWPVEELIDRCATATGNAGVIDRRLAELEPGARQVLACIGHSRQPRWHLGNLVELAVALGQSDGLRPVFELLQNGLLYPHLGPGRSKIKTFEQWLAYPPSVLEVFAAPLVATRAIGEDLGLPDLSSASEAPLGAAQEADGLEWLLRLAVLWQDVAMAPLRRAQHGGFFKRDADRLSEGALLTAAPHDRLADVADVGFLVEAWAEEAGALREEEGELRAGPLPEAWDRGLGPALEGLWAALPRLEAWNARDGYRGPDAAGGNPFPSAYLLAFLLLARLPEGAWARPTAIETWVTEQHPYWAGESMRPSLAKPWAEAFLLGVAYHLRIVQAARDQAGEWHVRLSPAGRWLLGLAEAPPLDASYTQTLLVQPNLEILAYRQGLTAGLVGRLTRFATWKGLGAACLLQLSPESVYRALESGQSFDTIRQTLEQHGTRALPPAVLESLRTWAGKRERITVYPSAVLLEFASAAELDEALARGLPATRIAPALAVVANESGIDFRQFRLTSTRDYALPPEQCVVAEEDGITLSVDATRSDLLLETELPRFTEPAGPSSNGRRRYRLTPASLAAAREQGMGLHALEGWFRQRTGGALPAAARLLLTGAGEPPPKLQRRLVLEVASEDMADGIEQWPHTRVLIAERLGPTHLAVEEDKVDLLRQHLREAGITLE